LKKYLHTVDNDWFNQRITLMMLCVIAAFAILFVRIFYLQVIRGEEYRALSENNSIRLQSVDAPRGLIFDRNGKLLVDNRPSFDLSIIAKDAKPLDRTIHKLAGYLAVRPAAIREALPADGGLSYYRPVKLRTDIGRDALAAVEVHKFDLPGVMVDIRPVRHYIHREQAAHLIGYLGEINAQELRSPAFSGCKGGDFIGRFGVEKAFEDVLRGKRGGRQVEVNVKGQVVRVLKTVPAQPGHNLMLTLDLPLQRVAEERLEGRVGAVVAICPQSGAILAMASRPAFDQNAFVSGLSHQEWHALVSNPERPMENKVMQAEYPPASTFKIIMAIAALEEKIIDQDTTFFCPGHLAYGDRVFRCWKRGGHGHMNVIRALAESCDVFFYHVGKELGVDRIAAYAKACGLGSKTGIPLDNEAGGLIPTAAWKEKRFGVPWQGGETLSVAIGQGYDLATPLQMVSVTAAIANGGRLYQPYIVRRIESADGTIVRQNAPVVKGTIPGSPETLRIVRQGLWEVVNTPHGTAHGIRQPTLAISGKTGTAQLVRRRDPDETGKDPDAPLAEEYRDHAWFVAYAPSDHPRIAVAVIVEHGEHGSTAAAPVAEAVIAAYLTSSKKEPLSASLMRGAVQGGEQR